MSGLEWTIARRYLRGGRKGRLASLITFIATGGVIVGVMALVIVMGVMTGLQSELRSRILIGSPHLQIFTYGAGLRVDDWRNALETIRSHEDVVAASPVVISQGLMNAGANFDEAVFVIGLESDTGIAAVTEIAKHFVRGDLGFQTTRDDVAGAMILGQHVKDRLNVYPGDRINMIAVAGTRYNRATGSVIPRMLPYEVAGSFNTGMYQYDENYVLMDLETAQEYADLDSAVSGIYVRVNDEWRAGDIGNDIVAMLGTNYRYVDWETQNFQLFSALKIEKLGMGLVLALIIMVAAFNIISTLTMVVSDKTREIGILRAMGLSQKSIRKIFILQGTYIGAVGTAIGAGLGLTTAILVDKFKLFPIAAQVYFVDHLPLQVRISDFLMIVVGSIAVAHAATIYPAMRAAALLPVEAIRNG
jgi:lipoprotein-releasing system permease protein